MTWRAARLRPPGVRGLEVYRHATPRGELWQRVSALRLTELAAAGVPRSAWGGLLVEDLEPALVELAAAHGAAAVRLSGGLTAVPGFASAIAARTWPVPVSVDAHASWAAVEAALAFLEASARPTVVGDVGQTALKASGPAGRVRRKRPLGRLPRLFIGHARPEGAAREQLLAAFASWVGEGLAAAGGAAPERLLLALPCPVDDDLTPGPCSYGFEGAVDLVPRILEELDARRPPEASVVREALVLNDAELAALGTCTAAGAQPVLCLTLGFGPGGALVRADAPTGLD